MPSLLEGFEYDIFISYRHNDNRSGWVTEFVHYLNEELASAIKEPVSVYFDSNPHDGLLETHNVDKSLQGKLKCLIFIPILSQTYCDSKSFAWQHEFCVFNKMANEDQLGMNIKLSNGNVTSRILPIKIHDLDAIDNTVIENEIEEVLRAIEFIFKSPGVNRPLRASEEHPHDNQNKTFYRDQINKVANVIKEIISALKSPTFQASALTDPVHRSPGMSRSWTKFILAGVTILILFVTGYYFYTKLFSTPNSSEPIDRSIAVLPFVNMSNDPQQEYFSDGITEEILNTLVKLKGLRVVGRTSSFQYKGKNENLKTIGKALGVALVIEGSVRKTNDEVRITAQLINAESGFHLWSHEYRAPQTDIFQLQDQVSVDIAKTLNSLLHLSEPLSKQKMATVNPIAYDYYLKGRQLFIGRDQLHEAVRFFKMSIKNDSTFDLAYSALASVLIITSPKSFEEAERQALKALSLDSLNADAYSALGMISQRKNKWIQSRVFYEKSLRLNSNSATSNLWFGELLLTLGHFTESLEYLEKATSLEPLYSVSYYYLAMANWEMRNYDLAISSAEQIIRIDEQPNIYWISLLYAEASQWDKLEDFIQTSSLPKSEKDAMLEAFRAVRNNDKTFLAKFLKKGFTTRWQKGFTPAWLLYVAGDYEGALSLLAKSSRGFSSTFSKTYSELRKLPKFKEAVRAFGYMEYWKKYGGPDVCPTISEINFTCN